jgi:hypothetical protein
MYEVAFGDKIAVRLKKEIRFWAINCRSFVVLQFRLSLQAPYYVTGLSPSERQSERFIKVKHTAGRVLIRHPQGGRIFFGHLLRHRYKQSCKLTLAPPIKWNKNLAKE